VRLFWGGSKTHPKKLVDPRSAVTLARPEPLTTCDNERRKWLSGQRQVRIAAAVSVAARTIMLRSLPGRISRAPMLI
jgi:hypothetical protein